MIIRLFITILILNSCVNLNKTTEIKSPILTKEFHVDTLKLKGTKWACAVSKESREQFKKNNFTYNPKNCWIDSVSMPYETVQAEYDSYVMQIQSCKPCWLEISDYKGNKVSEGYAIVYDNGSHHHTYFGLLKKYKDNSLYQTIKDTVVMKQLDSLFLLEPAKLRAYLISTGKSLL